MKLIAIIFLSLFLFSCEKSMDDVQPLQKADETSFRYLKDGDTTTSSDNPDDEIIDGDIIILDP